MAGAAGSKDHYAVTSVGTKRITPWFNPVSYWEAVAAWQASMSTLAPEETPETFSAWLSQELIAFSRLSTRARGQAIAALGEAPAGRGAGRAMTPAVKALESMRAAIETDRAAIGVKRSESEFIVLTARVATDRIRAAYRDQTGLELPEATRDNRGRKPVKETTA